MDGKNHTANSCARLSKIDHEALSQGILNHEIPSDHEILNLAQEKAAGWPILRRPGRNPGFSTRFRNPPAVWHI
jgi:hypothetical protein